jgi:thioredoxin-like negative regulator of GroEL
VLDRIAAERAGELRVVKVNVDDEPELAVRFGVSSIPTTILFADGEPVARAVGARRKPQLEKALGLAPPTGRPTSAAPTGLHGMLDRLLRPRS